MNYSNNANLLVKKFHKLQVAMWVEYLELILLP